MADQPPPNPTDMAHPPNASAEAKPYRRLSNTPLPPLSTPTTPQLSRRDPSIPTQPVGSKPIIDPEHTENPAEPWTKRAKRFIYDGEKKTVCDRTCKSWFLIIAYAIMYLIFLSTYTMMFLYFTLLLIKNQNFNKFSEQTMVSLLRYSNDNIGLTGIPLAEHNYPLIWYRNGETDDYNKYIIALDEVLEKRRMKRELGSYLGPCGQRPYGYGDKPCIIIKINKQLKWAGKPLEPGSPKTKRAPEEVQRWVQQDPKKYWLHCSGYHSYDKEHLGKIVYYPDPPGFDTSLYPLGINSTSPLVAFQVTEFTVGISIAIECKLWFENGASSVAFLLYVAPKRKYLRNATKW